MSVSDTVTQLDLIVLCYVDGGLRVRLLCSAALVRCVPEALPIQALFINDNNPGTQVMHYC